jgi:DNA-binding transcriptional regulator YiaG
MRRPSLRAALRQEVRRAVARQGAALSKRLDRARTRLRALRATVRKQAAELARAQRRLERVRAQRAVRRAAAPTGPALSPAQIRAARGQQSRRAFAEKLGVSANSIFLWETGRARPRGSNLARLAKARGGARPKNGRRRRGRARKKAA